MVENLEQNCYLGVTRYGMAGRLVPDERGGDDVSVPAPARINDMLRELECALAGGKMR